MANVMNPTVAPAPLFPEVAGNVFERTLGPDIPGQRGSLRFEEGVAPDTDVPPLQPAPGDWIQPPVTP